MKFSNWFGKKSIKSSQNASNTATSNNNKLTDDSINSVKTINKAALKKQIFQALKSLNTLHFPNGIYGQVSVVISDDLKATIQLPFNTVKVSTEISDALQALLSTPTPVAFEFDYKPTHPPSSLPASAKLVIAIASGKGGVGKSTVTANLAVALAQLGHKVGVLDADIYGPSMPMMFGLQGKNVTSFDEKTMEPFFNHGVLLNSIGFLVPADKATIWRGPMASRALMQVINETNWPELDILLVDMPPGTGDIQLTMSEQVKCHGAVIITTPQNVALADAEKGIQMFQKVNTPVLGVVENMSQFICDKCGAEHYLFGTGGGSACATKHDIPLLAQLSLNPKIRQQADLGTPFSLNDTNYEYQKLAFSLMMQMSKNTEQVITIQ